MDLSPLLITFKVSFAAAFFATVTAIPAAGAVTGLKRGRSVADALLSLPLVLPPTVVGFFLLILFGKNTAVGRMLEGLGIRVIFTAKGAAIASAVVAFPIIYRTARAAFEQLDSDLIDVARLIGYDKGRLLVKVFIPLSFHELASGVIIAFARAVGEFGATIMVAGNIPGRTRTMSIAVYTAMQSGNRELAYAWTAVILCLSFAVLIALDLISRRHVRKY
ncbi:MAG: molybdate ABC transporter permease subunit [Lachnospiraceae bacterium]|nr:molybdate ABC transporter permease subunit [Lachnospiraceae bacterium]